ncbi:hypothetical protein ACFWM3_24950 [Gottfriedia sp. NPDC058432]|uniref:hypothetical protein n=1 Tax=Gottfriedia sp. NPDC058432 TaxID=3346497 RepID=UPI00365996C7
MNKKLSKVITGIASLATVATMFTSPTSTSAMSLKGETKKNANQLTNFVFQGTTKDSHYRLITVEQAVQEVAQLIGQSVEQVYDSQPQLKFMSISASAPDNIIAGHVQLNVSSTYKPWLLAYFYPMSGNPRYIDKTKKPWYVGIEATGGKTFQGDVVTEVQTTGYYYLINGTFYNGGTMTHGGTTGVNAVWTTTYNFSYSTNVYKSYSTGRVWAQVY